jgi:carbonic anhydrase/acetyltransferase-like protein (isoleucine patch superfamily)
MTTPLVRSYRGIAPRIADDVFLAENATVVGDVVLAEQANVWFGAVLRGDVGYVRVGARSNIQDLVMVHMTLERSNTVIGEEVSIGHNVVVHGATIEDGALVGMGSILLDNCVIGVDAWVGAGSLVPGGMLVPPRTLVLGRPARVVRELRPDEVGEGRRIALRYLDYAESHRASRGD